MLRVNRYTVSNAMQSDDYVRQGGMFLPWIRRNAANELNACIGLQGT